MVYIKKDYFKVFKGVYQRNYFEMFNDSIKKVEIGNLDDLFELEKQISKLRKISMSLNLKLSDTGTLLELIDKSMINESDPKIKQDIISIMEKRSDILEDTILFRGESQDFTTSCEPSLYRDKNNIPIDIRLDKYMTSYPESNPWNLLSLEQHNNSGTELLDWSNSLYKALFFSAFKDIDKDGTLTIVFPELFKIVIDDEKNIFNDMSLFQINQLERMNISFYDQRKQLNFGIYKPPRLNQNIPNQDSIFMYIGEKYKKEYVDLINNVSIKVKIKNESKREILDYLHFLHNIYIRTIYS